MIKKLFLFTLIFSIITLASCDDDQESLPEESPQTILDDIKAVDASRLPEIENSGYEFKNANGQAQDFSQILKESGVNTIRLKLWVNPSGTNSSLNEVIALSQRLKARGLKIWLTIHYSDTWADPGQQDTPAAWVGLPFTQLKQQVYDYTSDVVRLIKPDIVQVGNEINDGFLWPAGRITTQSSQFRELLSEGIKAVRDHDPEINIMLHYAGHDGAEWFFDQVQNQDYDMIGISYYPIWHGRSLTDLETNLENLHLRYDKPILIAETAYPFTLGFNDFTNNIVGLESQLIIPEFPATPQGQRDFLMAIHSLYQNNSFIHGYAYWGAELVAWDGQTSSQGSPWENQALFDFQGVAVPALEVFNE